MSGLTCALTLAPNSRRHCTTSSSPQLLARWRGVCPSRASSSPSPFGPGRLQLFTSHPLCKHTGPKLSQDNQIYQSQCNLKLINRKAASFTLLQSVMFLKHYDLPKEIHSLCLNVHPWLRLSFPNPNDEETGQPADEEASGDLIILIHGSVQEGLLTA